VKELVDNGGASGLFIEGGGVDPVGSVNVNCEADQMIHTGLRSSQEKYFV